MKLRKIALIIAVLAAIIPWSKFSSAQPRNSIVGNWQTTLFDSGALYTIDWIVRGDNTAESIISSGGRQFRVSSTWSISNGILSERFEDGSSGVASIGFNQYGQLVVRVIDNGNPAQEGQVRVYTRKQVSFTGSQHCCECNCKGWSSGGKDGTCKNCGHKYSEHANSWGCLQH